MKKKLLLVIPAVIAAPVVLFIVTNSASAKSRAGGVKNGQLAKLYAEKPNNVASYEAGAYPKMEPLTYSGDKAEAKAKLLKIVADMPRTKVVTDNGDYIHVTFTSRLFRFVDDVEFLFNDDESVVHFRSASRVGYSDMGVNQKRMEEIRAAFRG